MPAVPTVAAKATGATYRSADPNAIKAAIDFLQAVPFCLLSVANPSMQIPNNKWTAITFDTVTVDPNNGWGGSSNPTRWTPNYPGWYEFVPTVGWAANATGGRAVDVWRNGSPISPNQQGASSPGNTGVIPDTFVVGYFNGTTDYAELMVYQSSGAPLTEQYAASLYGKWGHL